MLSFGRDIWVKTNLINVKIIRIFLYFDVFHFLYNFGDSYNEYLDNEKNTSIECQVCMGQEYSGELKGVSSLSLRVCIIR